MSTPPHDNHCLFRPVTGSCHACGRTPDMGLSVATVDGAICLGCWLDRVRQDVRDEERHRFVPAALLNRVLVGLLLGNDRPVAFPDGLDYEFARLLDGLRSMLVRVRLELHDGQGDSVEPAVEVRDGHLRRIGQQPNDEFSLVRPGMIGLFSAPDDPTPRSVLADEDYPRLLRITLLDPVILGDHAPRLIWEAPHEVEEKLVRAQRRRARVRAVLFLIHLLVIAAAITGPFVPFLTAVLRHDLLRAVAWGVTWWTVGTVVATSIAVWDGPPWPCLSILWRRLR